MLTLVELLYLVTEDRDDRADISCGVTKPSMALVRNNRHYRFAAAFNTRATGSQAAEEGFERTNSPSPSDCGEVVSRVAEACRTGYLRHTSMSTGDVAKVTTGNGEPEFYLCASCGWERIG